MYKTSEERRAKQSGYVRKWAKNNPEKHRAMVRKWEQENPEKVREIRRKARMKRTLRLRQEAIAVLGGQCVQCQCSDIRCLQIDHIIPLQGKKRIDFDLHYRTLIQGQTENLQVLCANCMPLRPIMR